MRTRLFLVLILSTHSVLTAQIPKNRILFQPGISSISGNELMESNLRVSYGIAGLRQIYQGDRISFSIGLSFNDLGRRTVLENVFFEDQLDPGGRPGTPGTLTISDAFGYLGIPIAVEYGGKKYRFSTGIKPCNLLYANSTTRFKTEGGTPTKSKDKISTENSSFALAINQAVYYYLDIGENRKLFFSPQIELFLTPVNLSNAESLYHRVLYISTGIAF